MFHTIKDLVKSAESKGSLFEVIMETEIFDSGESYDVIWERMSHQLEVMKRTVDYGNLGVESTTKLTGGDAKKLDDYINSGKSILDVSVLGAVRNAIATNEVNASMGLICATPTAGSAGVVPGVLLGLSDRYQFTHEQQVKFLFVAGGIGLIIANNASISGAMGGCQAEIGSASAMASAALVDALGGSPSMAAQACAMTIKNMLGLICDPVAGLVEVPCVKRNALGAAQAIVSADMALAGIESRIPVDDVIETMYRVGQDMPSKFKETAKGGLAQSETGLAIEAEIFNN